MREAHERPEPGGHGNQSQRIAAPVRHGGRFAGAGLAAELRDIQPADENQADDDGHIGRVERRRSRLAGGEDGAEEQGEVAEGHPGDAKEAGCAANRFSRGFQRTLALFAAHGRLQMPA
ncbi:MAG: hypothetical protein IPG61_20055 [bacterium]|nr:hypothetical protein [bacterium]